LVEKTADKALFGLFQSAGFSIFSSSQLVVIFSFLSLIGFIIWLTQPPASSASSQSDEPESTQEVSEASEEFKTAFAGPVSSSAQPSGPINVSAGLKSQRQRQEDEAPTTFVVDRICETTLETLTDHGPDATTNEKKISFTKSKTYEIVRSSAEASPTYSGSPTHAPTGFVQQHNDSSTVMPILIEKKSPQSKSQQLPITIMRKQTNEEEGQRTQQQITSKRFEKSIRSSSISGIQTELVHILSLFLI
jgi:hypothetical protein